jgi:hypothetical protein
MPLVLALEPDLRQAAIIKRVIQQRVRADLVLVESRDAAIAALGSAVPDVVLLTALLSPRDEEELITHLRSLDGADHLQTHTIPQLASTAGDVEAKGEGQGLLKRFRKKKEVAQQIPGCDPEMFAAEVRAFLERAAELKRDSAATAATAPAPAVMAARSHEPAAEIAPAIDPSSAWSSPFEWRRAEPPRPPADEEREAPRKHEPLVATQPLAVIAEEEERRRADDVAERLRVAAAEAEAEAERARAEAAAEKARVEQERRRVEAERARVEAERQRLEAEAAAERERARLEAEAVLRRERERLEKEAAAERERLRLEAEKAAAAERERLRLEAEAAERERVRLKAEADARAAAEAKARAAEAKARAAAEAKAKAEAEAKRVAEEKAKLEAEIDKIRQQRVKEREELAARRAAEKAEPVMLETSSTERLVDNLVWIHRRNR